MRDGLSQDRYAAEVGGLSGRPLFLKSTIVLAKFRARLGMNFPIIGVGGIDSADTAWKKLAAGANLVQIYTGFVYNGPYLAHKINAGLIKRITDKRMDSISKVTSCDFEYWSNLPLPNPL